MFEFLVFLLKNSTIFVFLFFRLIPNFGLVSVGGEVDRVCKGLIWGGGGARVCEGVGGGGGGHSELPTQPSVCRGGEVDKVCEGLV